MIQLNHPKMVYMSILDPNRGWSALNIWYISLRIKHFLLLQHQREWWLIPSRYQWSGSWRPMSMLCYIVVLVGRSREWGLPMSSLVSTTHVIRKHLCPYVGAPAWVVADIKQIPMKWLVKDIEHVMLLHSTRAAACSVIPEAVLWCFFTNLKKSPWGRFWEGNSFGGLFIGWSRPIADKKH